MGGAFDCSLNDATIVLEGGTSFTYIATVGGLVLAGIYDDITVGVMVGVLCIRASPNLRKC